jgi:hypothetical protein
VAGEVVLLEIAGVVWEALTVSQATPGPVANPGPPMLSEVPATMGQEWIHHTTIRQIPHILCLH